MHQEHNISKVVSFWDSLIYIVHTELLTTTITTTLFSIYVLLHNSEKVVDDVTDC